MSELVCWLAIAIAFGGGLLVGNMVGWFHGYQEGRFGGRRPTMSDITRDDPTELFDEDGILIAVKGHGLSRVIVAEAIREWSEWVFDDMVTVTADDRCVLRLSDYRGLCADFSERWMRPIPDDPSDPDFDLRGADWDTTYVWCLADHPDAIAYTDTGLT